MTDKQIVIQKSRQLGMNRAVRDQAIAILSKERKRRDLHLYLLIIMKNDYVSEELPIPSWLAEGIEENQPPLSINNHGDK